MLGYVRAHLLVTAEELADAKQSLAELANTEGYSLDSIYVAHADTAPAAFDSLLTRARDDDVTAVAVPGLHHLAVLGAPTAIQKDLASRAGTRVLTARPSP